MTKYSKQINLMNGTVEGFKWSLTIDISSNQRIWKGNFYVEDELRKHRHEIRVSDNNWANRVFPRAWRQQFEIHHEWLNGEVCYLIPAEEHLALHHGVLAE